MAGMDRLQQTAEEYALRLVVLFGSAARGHLRPDSDVDIGVLTAHPLSAAKRNRLWSACSQLFQADVDLTVLNHIEPLLGFQIAREGVLLYQAQAGAWETWRSYQVRRFWDTHKFREALRLYVSQRAEEMRHAGSG
jgi:predicted nucleotidyltransferase